MNTPFCLMVLTKSKRLSEVDVKSHDLADLPGKHHIPIPDITRKTPVFEIKGPTVWLVLSPSKHKVTINVQ